MLLRALRPVHRRSSPDELYTLRGALPEHSAASSLHQHREELDEASASANFYKLHLARRMEPTRDANSRSSVLSDHREFSRPDILAEDSRRGISGKRSGSSFRFYDKPSIVLRHSAFWLRFAGPKKTASKFFHFCEGALQPACQQNVFSLNQGTALAEKSFGNCRRFPIDESSYQ